jgi:hypothetical protein
MGNATPPDALTAAAGTPTGLGNATPPDALTAAAGTPPDALLTPAAADASSLLADAADSNVDEAARASEDDNLDTAVAAAVADAVVDPWDSIKPPEGSSEAFLKGWHDAKKIQKEKRLFRKKKRQLKEEVRAERKKRRVALEQARHAERKVRDAEQERLRILSEAEAAMPKVKTIDDWATDQEQFAHLPKLKPGFIRVRSSKTQNIYYVNTKTGQSTEIEPRLESTTRKLLPNWSEQRSKSTGQLYYFNQLTGESRFQPPVE